MRCLCEKVTVARKVAIAHVIGEDDDGTGGHDRKRSTVMILSLDEPQSKEIAFR